MNDAMRAAAHTVAEESARVMLRTMAFQGAGLDSRTVEALAAAGVDVRERLLFMTEEELRKIPGIGKAAMAKIRAYRARFLPSA